MVSKRGKDAEDFIKIRENLYKLETFLKEHAKDHPFAWGTKDPTLLDIHIYPNVVRL